MEPLASASKKRGFDLGCGWQASGIIKGDTRSLDHGSYVSETATSTKL